MITGCCDSIVQSLHCAIRSGAGGRGARRGPRQHGPTSGVVGGMKRCTAAGGGMNWNDTAGGERRWGAGCGAGGARIWPRCSGGPGAVYRRGGGERGEREREGIGGAGGGVVYPGVKQRGGRLVLGQAGCGPDPMKRPSAGRWGALPCRRGPGAGAGEGEPVDSGECGGRAAGARAGRVRSYREGAGGARIWPGCSGGPGQVRRRTRGGRINRKGRGADSREW